MRPVFIIGIYFFIVIMFPYLPYRVTDGNETVLREGIYPALPWFALCCLGFVCLALFISYRRFKKPMRGTVLLKRKDLNLRYLIPVMVFWVALIAFAHFVLGHYIATYQRLTPYFLIILISFVCYEVVWKRIFSVMHPDFVSFHSEAFHIRNFFGDEKRDLADLRAIRFRRRMNCIVLRFNDHMERKKLYLGDYSTEELGGLLDFVRASTGESVQIDKEVELALEQSTANPLS